MTALQPRILIIAVYFGQLPEYFPLWLNSCRLNPSFDWLLVTDREVDTTRWPANVHYANVPMEEFAEIISAESGVKVSMPRPYKACDFKPVYSALLPLAPGKWDFWGHCDLDMIFGNLSKFITPALLGDNDKIFGVGHLTIYRNKDETNNFYRRVHPELDFREILADSANHGFDEHLGVNRLWSLYNGRFYEDETIIADIDPLPKSLQRTSTKTNARNYRHQVFMFDQGDVKQLFWKDGRIQQNSFMYIHFQKRKIRFDADAGMSDRYYITNSGFIPAASVGELNKTMLLTLNPTPLLPSWTEVVYRFKHRLRIARRSLFKHST